ncbi:hypothetical protein ABZP36_007566 [Zizania latifolia]
MGALLICMSRWAWRGDVWEAEDLMKQMKEDGVRPNIRIYTSYINAWCKAGDMQRAEKVIEKMVGVGLKPNVKTYTTLIKGWARVSLPDRALKCFEEMKLAGLKPDEAAYHCLVTSLLSRATVMEGSTYTGILNACREIIIFDQIVSPQWRPVACELSKRAWNLRVIRVSWLASAAFLQEPQTVSNSSTGAEHTVTQAVNAADEAYSVMCVAVHISGWYRFGIFQYSSFNQMSLNVAQPDSILLGIARLCPS